MSCQMSAANSSTKTQVPDGVYLKHELNFLNMMIVTQLFYGL